MDPLSSLLQQIEFHEKFRGYDPVEVDAYVDQVSIAAAELKRRLRELEARVESAEARNSDASDEGPNETEETLKRTLLLAQRTADAAIAEAQERAEQILAEADAKARRQVTEVEQRSITLMTDAEHRSTAMLVEAESRSSQLLSGAQAEQENIVRSARAEAARITIEQRERVGAELAELEAVRDDLTRDVDVLNEFLATARSNLSGTSEKLAALVGEPDFLVSPPVPETSGASSPAFLDDEVEVPVAPTPVAESVVEEAVELETVELETVTVAEEVGHDDANSEAEETDVSALEHGSSVDEVVVDEVVVDEVVVDEVVVDEVEIEEVEIVEVVAEADHDNLHKDVYDAHDSIAAFAADPAQAPQLESSEAAHRPDSFKESKQSKAESMVWAPDEDLTIMADEPELDVETLLADAGIEEEAPYVAFFSDDDDEDDDPKTSSIAESKAVAESGSESDNEAGTRSSGISLDSIFGAPGASVSSEPRVARSNGEAPSLFKDAPVDAVAMNDDDSHSLFDKTPPAKPGIDPEVITDGDFSDTDFSNTDFSNTDSSNTDSSNKVEGAETEAADLASSVESADDEAKKVRQAANDAFLAEIGEVRSPDSAVQSPNDDALSAFFEHEEEKSRRWFGRGR